MLVCITRDVPQGATFRAVRQIGNFGALLKVGWEVPPELAPELPQWKSALSSAMSIPSQILEADRQLEGVRGVSHDLRHCHRRCSAGRIVATFLVMPVSWPSGRSSK